MSCQPSLEPTNPHPMKNDPFNPAKFGGVQADHSAVAREEKRSRLRLGDAVHAIANPIAKAIDKIAGTKIQGCQGCASRRARWNGDKPSN